MVTGEGAGSREGPPLRTVPKSGVWKQSGRAQSGGKPHPQHGGVSRASTQLGILVSTGPCWSF